MPDIEKNFNCVEPDYLSQFKCDAENCGAKCCRGFQVDIDRHTHFKYRSIKDMELRKKILDALYWNQDSQTYRMKLDEKFSCPMLDADNLCFIQKNFGESYLSNTCAEFPRRVYVVGDAVTRSLSLNCPVAAKLILTNPTPMKFQKISLRTTRAGSFFYRAISEVPTRKFLLPLQKICIETLQDETLSINKRLTKLGIMMSVMDYETENLSDEVLEGFKEKFHSAEFAATMERNFSVLNFDKKDYLQIMFQLMDELFGTAIIYYSDEQRNFAQYVPQAFGMVERTEKPIEEIYYLYEENFSAYDEFVRRKYPGLLENYLVQNFFAGLYPCRVPGNFMLNYFLFTTFYKFFEFGLICMAGVLRDNLKLNDILEFAGRFSFRIDHGILFQKFTMDYMEKLLPYPNEFFNSLIDFEN